MSNEIDFDATYRVEGSPGIAWRIRPLMHKDRFEDGEPTGYEYPDEQFVIGVMIGDNRPETIDVDDLRVIPEDGFCRDCGQIGCGHNTYE